MSKLPFLRHLTVVALSVGCTVAILAQPIDLGQRRELFVDRYLIEEMRGIELRLHPPTKAPRAQSPLPEKHMTTVIKDGNRYRAWYRSNDPTYTGPFHSGHPGETVHYAESSDGHEWTFPTLQLREFDGKKGNNAILTQLPPYLTNFMPFLDTRPGVDPAERYKAVAGYPGGGNKLGLKKDGIGLFGFVSPDGITWTKKNEIIPYRPEWRHAFDSPNVAFWSEAEQRYVCYFRTWKEPSRLRSIGRSTSPDFVNWSTPVEMNPNLPGEHLYTSGTHPYVRAPHLYLAMPTRFVPLAKDSAETINDNVTDVLFMTTRAGSDHYDRTFREPFIRPGTDPKRWTNRANYVAQNIVQTGPEELSIYHRSGDRYVLRLDGFASVRAGTEQGELLTKPLTFSGARMLINFSASAVGSVQVDLIDPVSHLILASSQRITGDAIDLPVKWRNLEDLSKIAGKPLRIRFTLMDADLYSFCFAP